jgi:hypothetical protein
VKERKASKRISGQYQRVRKNESFFKDAIKDVSHKAKGVYIGAVLGLIVMIVVSGFFEGLIATVITVLAVPLFMALGYFYGASFDWRDEIRDHMKK